MAQSQYSVSWESFKSNLTKGFSALQQNGEFVDMTLAADGCYVKVHKVVMALASPYIKELITTAPCQHPVFFLNNISSKILTLLLEYIYTGEALVPADSLKSFTDAARSLHINGLENLGETDVSLLRLSGAPQVQDEEIPYPTGKKRKYENDGNVQAELPAAARKISIKQEKVRESTLPSSKTSQYEIQLSNLNVGAIDDPQDFAMDDSIPIYSDDEDSAQNTSIEQNKNNDSLDTSNTPASNLQYSVSIRGSLQLILNRYIYNVHSSSTRTGVRRWRCVNYRNQKCTAFVVTKGNVVVSRANLHNHAFHDKKILDKIEKKCVFSALDDVQWYKEKEAEKEAQEDKGGGQDFMIMNEFTDISDKSNDLIKESE